MSGAPVQAEPASTLLRAMPLVFVLIWSTGFIVARYGMPWAPPLKFLALRYALSILCFLPWILWSRVRWPSSRSQWLHLAVTGMLMHAGYLGGVWAAVKAGMGSGLSSLIVGIQPILTAIWLSAVSTAGASRQTAVSPRQWMGLILGFFGLLMVVSRKFVHGTVGDDVNAINLALILLALVSITAGTLYQKHFVTPCDVRTANTVQLTSALLVTLPVAVLEAESVVWNSQLVGAMAWSVIGLTLGGSSLLYLLIQRGAASSVASLMYLVPPCTALLAWLLFDEPVTLATIAGTALTAVGVSLVIRASKR